MKHVLRDVQSLPLLFLKMLNAWPPLSSILSDADLHKAGHTESTFQLLPNEMAEMCSMGSPTCLFPPDSLHLNNQRSWMENCQQTDPVSNQMQALLEHFDSQLPEYNSCSGKPIHLCDLILVHTNAMWETHNIHCVFLH